MSAKRRRWSWFTAAYALAAAKAKRDLGRPNPAFRAPRWEWEAELVRTASRK